MKISIDGGALCGVGKYGNYFFAQNLIAALNIYAKENQYFVYTFCEVPGGVNLRPKLFWSTLRISAEEILNRKDYFFGLNQALPLYTPAKIISFSHGLSFHFYPKFYPQSARKMYRQHEILLKRSARVIVPSVKVKADLESVFKNNKAKITVIPYGVPFDMANAKVEKRKDFFLAVGMNHPIKNLFQLPTHKYKFVMADNVDRVSLKNLYAQAQALVTTSWYESFNLPVLEALSLGCPVIGLESAIIPELRPYANVARDQKELYGLLDKAKSNKLKKVDPAKIKSVFSWRTYIKKLMDLL